jgi:hypothetical protein
VPSRSAVAQAARILKLDFPMNYNDDSAAGVSDREPMAGAKQNGLPVRQGRARPMPPRD